MFLLFEDQESGRQKKRRGEEERREEEERNCFEDVINNDCPLVIYIDYDSLQRTKESTDDMFIKK